MICHYYTDSQEGLQRLATSLSGPFEFELPDDMFIALYEACGDNNISQAFYGWQGDKWNMLSPEQAKDYLVNGKEVPGPTPKEKDAVELEIDSKIYDAAEKFATKYDKKWKTVKTSFKKVTK